MKSWIIMTVLMTAAAMTGLAQTTVLTYVGAGGNTASELWNAENEVWTSDGEDRIAWVDGAVAQFNTAGTVYLLEQVNVSGILCATGVSSGIEAVSDKNNTTLALSEGFFVDVGAGDTFSIGFNLNVSGNIEKRGAGTLYMLDREYGGVVSMLAGIIRVINGGTWSNLSLRSDSTETVSLKYVVPSTTTVTIGGIAGSNPNMTMSTDATGNASATTRFNQSYNSVFCGKLASNAGSKGKQSYGKLGAGVLDLQGTSSYQGAFEITGGGLLINGPTGNATANASAMSPGMAVTVAAGAFLGGASQMNFNDHLNLNGTLAPGGGVDPVSGEYTNSIGTLTLNLGTYSNLNLRAGCKLRYELETSEWSDSVAVLRGSLNLGMGFMTNIVTNVVQEVVTSVTTNITTYGVFDLNNCEFTYGEAFAPGVYTLVSSPKPVLGVLGPKVKGRVGFMPIELAVEETSLVLRVSPPPETILRLF